MKSRLVAVVLLGILFGGLRHSEAQTPSGEALFTQARKLLTGANKNEPEAQRLLTEAIADPALSSNSRCYAYVYLGYIDDRLGLREQAIEWYKKALQTTPADSGILSLAEFGLTRAVTWIRHLDEGLPVMPAPSRPQVMAVGRGYVADAAPTGLSLTDKLTPEEWRENFDMLWRAIEKVYVFFQLKSIDWEAVRVRYEQRLQTVGSTADFYFLLFNLVAELRDSHASIQNFVAPVPCSGPGVTLDLFEGRPFVIASNPVLGTQGPEPGSEIVEVDGASADDAMEAQRRWLRGLSSDRAFRRAAAWRLLAGAPGTVANFAVRTPAGEIRQFALWRSFSLGVRPIVRNLPFDLTRQRFVHYGRHASGAGYIHIESFNGREEIADEFDHAMDALVDTTGLIIDVRDNTGGYGANARIFGWFLEKPVLGHVAYSRKAPEYGALTRSEAWYGPAGTKRYTRPVVLLINDVTGSAADLFTCDMRAIPGLVTIGSTTHGNLPGVAAFAVLPSGAVVRISNGYVADPRDRPIEVNGTTPDIPVETTVQDHLNGRDPALDTAVAVLAGSAVQR